MFESASTLANTVTATDESASSRPAPAPVGGFAPAPRRAPRAGQQPVRQPDTLKR
ncbi:hypothetical protein [Streptomyces sp. NPDC086010]|uniref:hypothetical protein n=1 Tax=Streptomyces sp. NPDC086010 TaxID=3365745 RepID=UPI0037D2284B